MITAGIDAGLQQAKVAVLRDGAVLSWLVAPQGREAVAPVATRLLAEAAEKAGLRPGDIAAVAATGMASAHIPGDVECVPEFLSLAKGAGLLLPSVRTALDIGAQKALAVYCKGGVPLKFAANDKCAAGSGRYLEMVAGILQVELDAMADLYSKSRQNVEVQNTCAVFAESEIVSLLHMKRKPEDILKGALKGVAERAYVTLAQVGREKDIAFLGGVARNRGMVMALEELLGHEILVPDNPEIINAVGAALAAAERRSAIPC